MIKIEVGKSYESRDKTEIVKIVEYDESEPLYRHKGDNGINYGPCGEYLASLGERPGDLVRRVYSIKLIYVKCVTISECKAVIGRFNAYGFNWRYGPTRRENLYFDQLNKSPYYGVEGEYLVVSEGIHISPWIEVITAEEFLQSKILTPSLYELRT